mmetsp:Transcript_51084/g.136281  ORF Transcript_51084/g.136281 Transcript_51084/m.136281 type:complete len:281 (+) Transcript_51084:25-867(+)
MHGFLSAFRWEAPPACSALRSTNLETSDVNKVIIVTNVVRNFKCSFSLTRSQRDADSVERLRGSLRHLIGHMVLVIHLLRLGGSSLCSILHLIDHVVLVVHLLGLVRCLPSDIPHFVCDVVLFIQLLRLATSCNYAVSNGPGSLTNAILPRRRVTREGCSANRRWNGADPASKEHEGTHSPDTGTGSDGVQLALACTLVVRHVELHGLDVILHGDRGLVAIQTAQVLHPRAHFFEVLYQTRFVALMRDGRALNSRFEFCLSSPVQLQSSRRIADAIERNS